MRRGEQSWFAAAGCRGWLCAIDLDDPRRSVEVDADEPVVAASVVKVPIAVEFFRQVASGRVDPTERVRISPADRTPGPTGFSTFTDDVELSLRDAARMMLHISDNAATDVIVERVGVAAVNATMREWGLTQTVLAGPLRELVDSIGRDLGFAGWSDFVATVDDRGAGDGLPHISAFDPARTSRTTAREAATLLRLIWLNPNEDGAAIRGLMAGQLTRHRLAVGFPAGVRVAAKSGSLMGIIRNEIGVVSYPDGGRYAVAVFTRSDPGADDHAVNEAIGAAAAHAVGELRRPEQ